MKQSRLIAVALIIGGVVVAIDSSAHADSYLHQLHLICPGKRLDLLSLPNIDYEAEEFLAELPPAKARRVKRAVGWKNDVPKACYDPEGATGNCVGAYTIRGFRSAGLTRAFALKLCADYVRCTATVECKPIPGRGFVRGEGEGPNPNGGP